MAFPVCGCSVLGERNPAALRRGGVLGKRWPPPLRAVMPEVELTIVVGRYAQDFYLGNKAYKTLTETVRHFEDYLPDYFPLVHPSPRNQLWLAKNPWFEQDLLPILQKRVEAILTK